MPGDQVPSRNVASWEELKRELTELGPDWKFRGQSRSSWDLTTSLERTLKPFLPEYQRKDKTQSVKEWEDAIVRLFKREAPNYLIGRLPETEIEWLALMQHYGAPTRLLDWTTSPYAACYFALENAEEEPCCAVWAVNITYFQRFAFMVIQQHGGYDLTKPLRRYDPHYLDLVLNEQILGVFPVEPFRRNERLMFQQGMFLVPGNPERTFMANFRTAVHGADWLENCIRKIVIPAGLRSQVLFDLEKMNITRATLFPGIDGFAQSLRYRLAKFADPYVIQRLRKQLHED